jgi:DNA-binding response OmpR family regulator
MRRRILVVDDNADALEFIKEALNYEKYDVKIARQGNNILENIQAYNPDLVMLDYNIHGVKGDCICRQIKSSPRFFNLPVIICSAYLDRNTNKEKLACGCDAVIAKPFSFNELIDKVGNLISL